MTDCAQQVAEQIAGNFNRSFRRTNEESDPVARAAMFRITHDLWQGIKAQPGLRLSNEAAVEADLIKVHLEITLAGGFAALDRLPRAQRRRLNRVAAGTGVTF